MWLKSAWGFLMMSKIYKYWWLNEGLRSWSSFSLAKVLMTWDFKHPLLRVNPFFFCCPAPSYYRPWDRSTTFHFFIASEQSKIVSKIQGTLHYATASEQLFKWVWGFVSLMVLLPNALLKSEYLFLVNPLRGSFCLLIAYLYWNHALYHC